MEDLRRKRDTQIVALKVEILGVAPLIIITIAMVIISNSSNLSSQAQSLEGGQKRMILLGIRLGS